MPSFAGIDLTCSPNKKSAYALLGNNLSIIRLKSLVTVDDIIAAIERDRPDVIGIDSPLSKPSKLHCFAEDCTCLDPSPKGRKCERDLMQEGIWSYYTTKRTIIRKMIPLPRAIELKKELCARGFRVIEVYPYATKRRLWHKYIPKSKRSFPRKTTPQGRRFLQDRLSTIIRNIGKYPKLTHDHFDAIIAAYTAYLYHDGKTQLVGDTYEGQIIVPAGT